MYNLSEHAVSGSVNADPLMASDGCHLILGYDAVSGSAFTDPLTASNGCHLILGYDAVSGSVDADPLTATPPLMFRPGIKTSSPASRDPRAQYRLW